MLLAHIEPHAKTRPQIHVAERECDRIAIGSRLFCLQADDAREAAGLARKRQKAEAITVKRWLHRLDEDASGLTFEDWEPSEGELNPNAQHAFMIVNSSEVRGVASLGRDARAQLQEILPPELEGAARVSGRTRAAGLRQVEGAGPRKVRLREDMDNLWRERCE